MTVPDAPSPVAAPVRRLVCVALNAAVDKIAAVDRLRPGEIHRPRMLSVVPGGKAINVARAAASFGLPVTVVPVVGGHAGAWVEEALAAEGLRARPVRVPGETRTCLSVEDRSTGRLTEFYEAGVTLDDAGWADVEAAIRAELADPASGGPGGAVVVVSGSLPVGAPPDAYARIVRLANAAGARAVVDVGGEALALAAAAGPWLAKVNAHEAAAATGLPDGDEPEALAAARALRALGARTALVTRGVDGAVLVGEDGAAWRVAASPERGRYAVGSGDSFLAGFLAGLAAGEPPPAAARRASAAGTANALHPGQGRVDPADLARLLPTIAAERLDG